MIVFPAVSDIVCVKRSKQERTWAKLWRLKTGGDCDENGVRLRGSGWIFCFVADLSPLVGQCCHGTFHRTANHPRILPSLRTWIPGQSPSRRTVPEISSFRLDLICLRLEKQTADGIVSIEILIHLFTLPLTRFMLFVVVRTLADPEPQRGSATPSDWRFRHQWLGGEIQAYRLERIIHSSRAVMDSNLGY